MFFGESMFSRRTDASKIAMARLAVQLDRWQVPLIDCQLETEHLLSLGAEHMPRRQFVREVERLVREPEPPWRLDDDLRGDEAHAPRILRVQELRSDPQVPGPKPQVSNSKPQVPSPKPQDPLSSDRGRAKGP
jgi:hypothetical protein